MKRFVFRLQRILDLRIQIRDESRQELVLKNAYRDQQIGILADLQDEFMQLGLSEGGTYSAEEITRLANYGEFLTERIKKQRLVVDEAIKIADEAREGYIEASKEAKVLEMLRERKLAEYNLEALRKEGVLLDELGQRVLGKG